MNQKEMHLLNIVGTILILAGICVWGVYAVFRYGVGWDVTVRHFLPLHLAGVLPGMILRRHRFFRGMIRRILSLWT